MMRTSTSFSRPSNGVHSKRHPGEMVNRRESSAGMVTIFFVVTVVCMEKVSCMEGGISSFHGKSGEKGVSPAWSNRKCRTAPESRPYQQNGWKGTVMDKLTLPERDCAHFPR
jgi:hypothetical protein